MHIRVLDLPWRQETARQGPTGTTRPHETPRIRSTVRKGPPYSSVEQNILIVPIRELVNISILVHSILVQEVALANTVRSKPFASQECFFLE